MTRRHGDEDKTAKRHVKRIFFSVSPLPRVPVSPHRFFLFSACLFLFFLLASCAARQAVSPEPPPVVLSQPQLQPMQEMKGEQRTVLASWYGPDFHGKPTSSGEMFNMYALTCAHRDYPFGTRLRVINTRNSKEVECTVNDRGPFVAGRDLDLSYAAAKKIDLIGPGTAAVLIEPVGRDMRYVKYVRYSGRLGQVVTIQVGSFRDETFAKRLKTALELRYSNVYIMQADVGGVKHYRVRIGKFRTRDEAAASGKALADEGYNVLITKFEQQI